MATHYQLTDRDRSLLAFEELWPNHTGAKEEAIRSEFRISPARYVQLLHQLVRRPEALIAKPMLVNRLIRSSEDRSNSRASRVLLSRNLS